MEEYKILTFIRKQSSWLISLFIIMVGVFIFFDRKMATHKGEAKKEFATLERIFGELTSGRPISAEEEKIGGEILNRYPELHPSYDWMLALSHLQKNEAKKALEYSNHSLERMLDLLPTSYTTFAKASSLIEENRLDEALTTSLSLEKEIAHSSHLANLRTFNFLRIISLAKKLQREDLRVEFAQKIEQEETFKSLLPLFQEGSFSFENYLKI